MASLGNIWFDLGLVDKTGKDLEKILKKLKENDFKLEVKLDEKKVKNTLTDTVKNASNANKSFESLSKALGISVKQAKELADAVELQDSKQIAVLMNTEKIIRAKERLLELERSVYLRQLEHTNSGKAILTWTEAAKKSLESINISDKMEVIKATGADLAAQINIRKNMMRKATQTVAEEVKETRGLVVTNDKVEKALLRIQKIRDRIKNDPFRDQEGYKGVNSELDKMAKTIESVRGKSKAESKDVLGIGLDRSIQGVENLIKKQDLLYRNTNKQVTHMGRIWGQLGNQVKNVISIYAMQRFTRSLIEMGGEFEKQKFALRAIIGDLGKADQIYNNLKKVAVKSPFHFGDFAGYAKQLAAFSIPVNEIYDTTKRLADVSAGLGVDMSRIILAYGQIRAASFLRGQEVRQLTEAGIPIIEELAIKLTELRGVTVSTSEVFDAISRREVPFAMVKEVFKELTDEGGKFYKMQEVLAQSLSGKWSNLTSHYQIMLDDMAQSSRGILNGLIEALTWFVKNADRAMALLSGIFVGGAMAGIVKIVEVFIKTLDGAKFTLVNFGKTITKMITPAGMAGAAVGILTSAVMYVKNRSDSFNESITETIQTTHNLIETVRRSTKSLIDLAEAEKNNVNVTAERQKVIKKLAQTEPELAEEVAKHADNVEWLTKKTEEYIVAYKAARDLEISSKGESWRDSSSEKLEEKLNEAEADLRKKMIILRRDYALFVEGLGYDVEESLAKMFVRSSVSEKALSIINDGLMDDAEKMAKIYELQFHTYSEQNLNTLAESARKGFIEYNNLLAEYEKRNEKFKKEAKRLTETLHNTLMQNAEYASDAVDEVTKKAAQKQAIAIADLSDTMKRVMAEILGLDLDNLDDGKKELTGWQKEVSDIIGNLVTIDDTTTIKEAINDITSEADKARKFLESIDIDKARSSDTKAAQAIVKQYEAEEEALEKLMKALTLLGVLRKTTGGDTTKKDPLAEQIKERVDLLKEAISYYNKYIPIMGRVNALEKVQSESKFKGIGFNPDAVKDMLNDLYKQLGDTEAQKKVKESITSMLTDIEFNDIKDNVDKLAKDTSDYIDRSKERWDLFDKLFEQSGDRTLSFTLAFGTEDDEGVKNFVDSMEKKLLELTKESGFGLEDLLGMRPDDLESNFSKPIIDLIGKIKDERVKARESILMSDAKAIAETAGLEAKAAAIRASYEEKIRSTDNENAAAAYTEQMNNEISDLYAKAIQLSPVWAELFGDVSDYSYRMLKDLVAKAKELAGTAEEIVDKDGKGTGMFKLTDGDDNFEVKGEELTRMLKAIAKKSDEIRKNNPFAYFTDAWKRFLDAPNGEEKEKAMKQLFESAAMVSSEVGEIAASFADMFDALGNEELADTVGLIGDISNELGGIAEGFSQGGAAGGILATLKAVPSIIGSIARNHDKKLDRKIQKSEQEVRRLQNAYENVNKEVERQLGAMTKGQVDRQINSLKGQIEETQNMLEKERKKKKSDQGKIDDYKQQIKELNDQVQYFYEDLAKNLYDIDIKGWAGQFSSAIMDAWRKGGDAAKAYEQTANEVLANVANKMLAETILEPVFKELRKQLPEMLDKGKLTKEDMGEIAKTLVDVGDKWGSAIDELDQINEMIKEQSGGRFDLKFKDELESNLGKGIQATTEDTSQLLASYLNAIRQDVSVNRDILTNLADAITGSISNNIATAVADLKKIESNTFRSANGVDDINDKLDSVMNGSKRIYTE